MIRAALLSVVVLLPSVSQAQAITDQPRAYASFAGVQGYDFIDPERSGTHMAPFPNELGLVLVSQMFRNTCLALEAGSSLDAVLPDGFAAYSDSAYLMGTETTSLDGPVILSPTGDIDIDEEQGHPTVRISPRATGTSCRLEWLITNDIAADTQDAMASYLTHWTPFEFSLVHAARPSSLGAVLLQDFSEWDRICGDDWCPMTINYDMPSGRIIFDTTLNITTIEGTRP